jgi:hypothetical protein
MECQAPKKERRQYYYVRKQGSKCQQRQTSNGNGTSSLRSIANAFAKTSSFLLLFLLLPPLFGKNAKLHVHSGYKNLEEEGTCIASLMSFSFTDMYGRMQKKNLEESSVHSQGCLL